ncbi:3-phenylpropionate/cinnamic acid dioxygenase ferredoxin subunit-like [Littorina saxatilis]|uniref:Rieske domain-containing protein n=1 Tax=Littorina saxatilis TaxID=31220 RepID=A0AAN9B8E4_9CAEN
MSDTDESLSWFEVGTVEELKGQQCRRLYTPSKQYLALFCVKGSEFYATSAQCPHASGPLDQGDIEDMGNDTYLLTCPSHFYRFDLKTGVSTTGLKLKTYPTEVRDGKVFVKAPELVSIKSIKPLT